MVGETECGAIPQTDRSESLLNVIELFLCELFASFQCVDMICLVIEERTRVSQGGRSESRGQKENFTFVQTTTIGTPKFSSKVPSGRADSLSRILLVVIVVGAVVLP